MDKQKDDVPAPKRRRSKRQASPQSDVTTMNSDLSHKRSQTLQPEKEEFGNMKPATKKLPVKSAAEFDLMILEKVMEVQQAREGNAKGSVSKLHRTIEDLNDTLMTVQARLRVLNIRQNEMILNIDAANQRAGRMRLDKQILHGLAYIFGKRDFSNGKGVTPEGYNPLSSTDTSALNVMAPMPIETTEHPEIDYSVTSPLLVICPVYPGGKRAYGGEFVMRRVEAYDKEPGLNPTVVEVNASNRIPVRHDINGIDVLRVDTEGLEKILSESEIGLLAVHSMERDVWQVVKPYLETLKLIFWVHGFEARDWRDLKFNFNANELRNLESKLDQANADRRETMSEAFLHPEVTLIFVSNFMQKVAEDFVGMRADRALVIHNSIDPQTFPYQEKSPELRKRILWVRSFSARNYSNDISRNFVVALSKKPYFKDLEISIFGDGRYFNDLAAPLAEFENVTVVRRFLDTDELREQHEKHGVIIVPSRWDSQGLTCGEAMAAGLVPLTSRVTALPEFVDEGVAIMADIDDHEELVEGYDRLFREPDLFQSMSAAASKRSLSQCGPESTLDLEMKLFRDFLFETIDMDPTLG